MLGGQATFELRFVLLKPRHNGPGLGSDLCPRGWWFAEQAVALGAGGLLGASAGHVSPSPISHLVPLGPQPRAQDLPSSSASSSRVMASWEGLRSCRLWRAVLAEVVGTFVFVGVVLGASCPTGGSPALPPPTLQPALAAGLAGVGLAQSFGEVSGAQVNPALTLALALTRRLDLLSATTYVLAQSLGAVLASAAFYLALPRSATAQLVTLVSSEAQAGQALGMEIFSTFQLALTTFATADQRRRETGQLGSLAVGFSVTAGALAAGPFSGGSMNPARSLGPAVVTGIWDCHWVYWLGPALGATVGGLCYELLFSSGASREKLVAWVACRDVEMVEAASGSRSSLSAPAAQVPPPRPSLPTKSERS
ncbi:aquaporin-2-like [Tachyglossus aculeatus]|uniref:aquaporin-2-like n=1 Tax=Tachyglossus aculeatus TaxID=9261 RepID=UPI0018F2EAF1|nr:aquaporin-2-like [Tachyglossus aculeatus]